MKISPKKVLVVEDEASLRQVLRDKLVHEGFSTIEAKNGAEGLKSALFNHPDLILLDIVMPIMDGITMLKQLRLDPWGKTAAVILLTNLSDTGVVAEAIEQGTYDFLVKTDWKIEDVMGLVNRTLGK